MLELMKLLVLVGGALALAFMVLLALPQCKLREMLMPFVAWGLAVLCAAYAISPIDALPELALGPFGLVDDLAAVVVGIGTARAAMKAHKAKQVGYSDSELN